MQATPGLRNTATTIGFRDLNSAITRLATLATAGRITVDQVNAEITHLKTVWMTASRASAESGRTRHSGEYSGTHDQLRAAAQLRAATGLKTPDALQLVAAIGGGCTMFLTNDSRLPSVQGLRVVELASYAK